MADRPILLIGLDPLDPPPNAPVPPSVLQSIAEKVQGDVARATRNGFPCTVHYLDWRDAGAAMAALETRLEGLRGRCAAIIFGRGIRMHADPVLFEGAIEVVRKVFGWEEVKVLFNDGPDRQCATIERAFGMVMGE